jgi:hypothetical protein
MHSVERTGQTFHFFQFTLLLSNEINIQKVLGSQSLNFYFPEVEVYALLYALFMTTIDLN